MRLDRRTTLKWMLTAAATVPSLGFSPLAFGADTRPVAADQKGYGTDPDLTKEWRPGGPWPLTLGEMDRLTATALCDLIIPADDHSPAASTVGVVDFIDEWISAPYPQQRADRELIVRGLPWMNARAARLFGPGQYFASLDAAQQARIADEICKPVNDGSELEAASKFFARFRDLTAGGFYTTPVGMKDIGYRGNVPLATFDGPPLEALKKAGLV